MASAKEELNGGKEEKKGREIIGREMIERRGKERKKKEKKKKMEAKRRKKREKKAIFSEQRMRVRSRAVPIGDIRIMYGYGAGVVGVVEMVLKPSAWLGRRKGRFT